MFTKFVHKYFEPREIILVVLWTQFYWNSDPSQDLDPGY